MCMYFTSVVKTEVVELLARFDSLLLDSVTKRIKLLPISVYSELDRTELRIWCHYRTRYLIPTVELVDWLIERIDGRRAIEIGASNSDLAYYLGIRTIASYPVLYASDRLAPLFPGQIPTRVVSPGFHQMDVMQAILELRPEVAIGAWIPDKFNDCFGDRLKYAPNEYQIIQNVEYIHIGTEKIHGRSKILEFPHETVKPLGLVSRTSANPPDDVVHIWKKLQ